MAALESRMTTDAPMDDLEWEQEVFDADRCRGRDAVMAGPAQPAYTSAVRHDASGGVVGTTMLRLPKASTSRPASGRRSWSPATAGTGSVCCSRSRTCASCSGTSPP